MPDQADQVMTGSSGLPSQQAASEAKAKTKAARERGKQRQNEMAEIDKMIERLDIFINSNEFEVIHKTEQHATTRRKVLLQQSRQCLALEISVCLPQRTIA